MAVLLGILLLLLFYRVRKIQLHWRRKFFANGMRRLRGKCGMVGLTKKANPAHEDVPISQQAGD